VGAKGTHGPHESGAVATVVSVNVGAVGGRCRQILQIGHAGVCRPHTGGWLAVVICSRPFKSFVQGGPMPIRLLLEHDHSLAPDEVQVSSGEPAWRQRLQLLSLAVATNISLRGFNCHQRPLHLSVERQSQRALPRLAKPQPRRWNRSRAKPTNQQSALSLLHRSVRW